MLDFNGYVFNGENYLDYVNVSYFTIICISSVGYGDIYPKVWQTRILMVAMIITNITVLSNFLSHFTELLFSKSSLDRDYDFYDHLVIFGEFPDYFLADFLS